MILPQSSSEVGGGAGAGGRAPRGGSALYGQSPGPGGAGDSQRGCGRLGGLPHGHLTEARRLPKPPGEGPRAAPEPAAHQPDPRSGPPPGILRAPVLLLHLRLRVHQQRAADGAHEGTRGGHNQHHPQQGAAAASRSTNSRVRPQHPHPPPPPLFILTLTTLQYHNELLLTEVIS